MGGMVTERIGTIKDEHVTYRIKKELVKESTRFIHPFQEGDN